MLLNRLAMRRELEKKTGIEKLGPRTYRLVRGGFTSCVQPTPRWEVTASSVTINLDEYWYINFDQHGTLDNHIAST